MKQLQGAGARQRGFVRAVFSDKRGAACIHAGLLRDLLGALRKSAALDRAKIRAIGARARVASSFADYLVSEPVEAFAPGRAKYADCRDFDECTGRECGTRRAGLFLDGGWEGMAGGGPLDAPLFIPAGAMRKIGYGDGLSFNAPAIYMRTVLDL